LRWPSGRSGRRGCFLPRIKVLQFITGFHVGGTERHVAHLATRLDPSCFDVHIACLQREGPLYDEFAACGLPLIAYPIKGFLRPGTLRQQLRFATYLKHEAIDIVHAYGFYPIVFAVPVSRLAGPRVVMASIRDNGDPWTRAQRLVQRCSSRPAHCILVNASAVRARLRAGGYTRRSIAVIRNGVDVDRFAPRPPDAALRTMLGLPPGSPLVVAVSRLNPMKGLDDYLEAAALLAGRFAEARFVIVGDGASRWELEEQARRLGLAGRVVFTGTRLDVAAILSQAAVSVAPSLSEGLSNVVLESMAAGAAVVATRVGGTPEILDDGVTGLLVPPCDAPALADAIGRLLGNAALARRLGDAARARAIRQFSMQHMVIQTESLYRALLRGEPSAAMDEDTVSRASMTLSPPPAVLARRRRELWDPSRQRAPF
jgi:glycosyltransferase involved in cell wall biosynthesis